MKKIKIILIGAFLLSATSMYAQKDINVKSTIQKVERKVFKLNTPEALAKFETEKMTTMLDLTESQILLVSNINLEVENKIETIKFSRMVEEKKQAFILENLKDRMNTLKQILTIDQFEEYSASLNK